MRSSKHPREMFFKHWVGKEAVLKALGLGITEHLKNVAVFPKENGQYDVQLGDIKDIKCFACELVVPKEHLAAVAWLIEVE